MRSLFLFLLFFSTWINPSFAQPLTLNSIRLIWEDFQVRENSSGGPYTAQVSVPIRYKMSPGKDDNHFLFESEAYIDITRSRVNKDFLDHASFSEKQDLLNHEKCHVAVTYIYHKKLQLMMEQHQFQRSIKLETDSMIFLINRELREKNSNYDSATRHGEQKAEQKIWERKLLAELNLLHPDGVIYTATTLSLKKSSFLKFDDTTRFDYTNRKPAFEENFDDDRNGWLSDSTQDQDSGVFATISNGLMEINNSRKADNWGYNIKGAIDYSRDFEIHYSFMIRKTEGKRKGGGGFYWGVSDSLGFTWITIGRAGIGIVNCHGGDHKNDKKKNTSVYPALKEGVFCNLVVRKMKDKYSVFLNDQFKVELPYEALVGNELCLAASHNSIMVFDYLKIYYLD